MSKSNTRLAQLIKTLTQDNKLEHIANVIDKISIKDSEQLREIVPIEKWIMSDYFV